MGNVSDKSSLEKHGFDLSEYASLALRWRNMPLHKKAEAVYNATPLIGLRGLAHLLGMTVDALAEAMRKDEILRSVVNDNMSARYGIEGFVPAPKPQILPTENSAVPIESTPKTCTMAPVIKKREKRIKADGKVAQCITALTIAMGHQGQPWPGYSKLQDLKFAPGEISNAIKILKAEGKLIGLGHKKGYRWAEQNGR